MEKFSQLTARRPYLLRAFYYWLRDNKLMPHLVIDINIPGVQVPLEYVHNGQIILNISPHAVDNLQLANNEVCFNARFGGVLRHISVPMASILAIYARENGAGTMFETESAYELTDKKLVKEKKTGKKNNLYVIDGSSSTGSKPHQEVDNFYNKNLFPHKGRPYLYIVK